MKSKKDTKKIQVKQKKKTRKNQNNKRKTKKKCKKGEKCSSRVNKRKLKIGGEGSECAICWERLNKRDNLNNITTTCGHKFHLNCLRGWCKKIQSKRDVEKLQIYNGMRLTPFTCPMCRQPIEETCKEAIKKHKLNEELDEDEEAFLDYLEDTRELHVSPPESETESEMEQREFWQRDDLVDRIRNSRVVWDNDLEDSRESYSMRRNSYLPNKRNSS